MTLKTRLALMVTGVTFVSLAASFALVILLVRRDETQDLDRALARQAAQALARRADVMVEDGRVDIPEMLGGVARHVAVYRGDGSLEQASQSFEGDVPSLPELGVTLPLPAEGVAVTSDAHDETLRAILQQIPGSDRILLYAASQRALDHDTAFLMRVLSLLLLAAMVCVVLAARWLGERLVREVAAVAAVAHDVAQGDLQARAGRDFSTSEVRALAAALDYMVERLEALVSTQKRFIAHAAHELRSPLSTLRGELQLALRRPREGREYQRALEEALLDVEALVNLSEDLLVLARVQATGMSAARCELGEVVDRAVEQAVRRAQQSGVRLVRVPSDAGACQVAAPAKDLTRALRNLLDNAIRHSQSGDEVRMEHWRDEQRAYVAVTDHGPGVQPVDRARIFEPFFRGTASVQESDGVGLGLAIAREIVERAAGDVALDVTQTAGARFVVSLPVVPNDGA